MTTTVAMTEELITVRLQASGNVRRVPFLGRQFLVIPAVLVRSQVLHNNIGRLLLPATDITAQWADQWNGIPVLVGPHPTRRGVHVSGRTPELWNERGAGWIFNARADDDATNAGVRRLIGEVWLDEERAPAVNGLPEVLAKVAAGQPVELSTGFAAHVSNEAGQFAGASYEGIMHPAGADHLVISTTMTGACAVDHGCGLGVNAQPTEGTGMPGTEAEAEQVPVTPRWKVVLSKLADVFALRTTGNAHQDAWSENIAHRMARELEAQNSMPASDQEFANILRDALQAKFGGGERRVNVSDVFSGQKQVVFWLTTPFGAEPPGAEYYRSTFEEGAAVEGAAPQYSFTAPERVRRMTGYEPVSGAEGTGPIAGNHSSCSCQEGDNMPPENETKMNEQLAALSASVTTLTEQVATLATAANAATTAANAAATAEPAGLKALTDAVTALTGRVDAMHNAQQAEVEAERTELVKELSANNRTPFSAAELEAQPVDALRKLAQMAKIPVANYAGRGGPRTVVQSEPEAGFVAPVPYFQKPAAAAATS